MKKNEETKKGKEIVSNIFNKASIIGKKVADGVQKGAKNIVDQTQKSIHDQKMKKYNPITPKDFISKDFNLPNIIEIVDDAIRRDVEVCKGAIGWIDRVNDVEVLHLYDEWVEKSGIQFVPIWKCDNVYCVDNFDRKKYIDSNSIFGRTNNEKLAELEHIAYCLGAKSCSVEIVEANAEVNYSGLKLNVPQIAGVETKSKSGREEKESGKTVSYFNGNDNPVRPKLKWFEHDDNINRLIEMRCSDRNSIKSKVLELKGSSSVTMSQKAACAIDKILKIKGSVSMEKQAIKEHSSKLVFELEF